MQRPLRFREQISGLHVNGDIDGTNTGRLNAYDCHNGTFRLTLIPKKPETIEIRVNGRLALQAHVQIGWSRVGTATSRSTGAEAMHPRVTPTGCRDDVFEFIRGS